VTDSSLRGRNGLGLGARIGERRLSDPRGWLREQLSGDHPTVSPPAGAEPDAISDALRAFRSVGAGQAGRAGEAGQRQRQQLRRKLVDIAAAESRAALGARATTERPFVERLVAFWSNHLCVSTGAKILVAPLAGSYEREAIRPHVLGRFEDMVLASAKHPAMLVYLDNFQSIGPNSRGARLGGRRAAAQGARRGLNENYARELLELHTLGVNGGYTQQDVQELARILTGWTVGGLAPRLAGRELGFAFEPLLHEPGSKTVLGTRYGESGVEEGEQAIRALCRHKSTARFIATKLVAHFVSDEPPASAVDRIARVFTETGGDLRAVSAALIDLPDAWADSARKFRTPQDWLVAILRAFNARDVELVLLPVLKQLRHPLWAPQSPKGFGDATQEWSDPDSLLNRAELARTIARRVVRDAARFDPRQLLDVVDVPTGDPLPKMLADTSIPADERIALALASPAFQWR
jgi:uncharacterized protein (DUF1800 family)